MILNEIVVATKKSLEEKKNVLSLAELQTRVAATPSSSRDFYTAVSIAKPIALIAEIKRASPSAGVINNGVNIADQARTYASSGAAALSIVTNKSHFKGDDSFLQQIRQVVTVPLLRKDFIVDPYQIYESKYLGADAILLIARLLTASELTQYISLAHSIRLSCLVETHDESDITKALESGAQIIGINVRDLDTFKLDVQRAQNLAKLIPTDKTLVAESGIETRADVMSWRAVGARSVLVGTTLMKAENVKEKIKELIAV